MGTQLAFAFDGDTYASKLTKVRGLAKLVKGWVPKAAHLAECTPSGNLGDFRRQLLEGLGMSALDGFAYCIRRRGEVLGFYGLCANRKCPEAATIWLVTADLALTFHERKAFLAGARALIKAGLQRYEYLYNTIPDGFPDEVAFVRHMGAVCKPGDKCTQFFFRRT